MDTNKRTVSAEMRHEFMSRISSEPFAMEPRALRKLMGRAAIGLVIEEPKPLEAHLVACQPVESSALGLDRTDKGVVVLPLRGVIDQHSGWFADIAVDELDAMLTRLAADPNIGAIVLDWDSPGGSVAGVPEAADKIRQFAKSKPVYSLANAGAFSAAYWLGSAATKTFVTPSGAVGSVGVWTMHIDASKMMEDVGWDVTLISAGKYKVEGHPYGPLDDEARDAIQADVDAYYDMFVKAVAKNRGVSVDTVRNGYGEGRTVMAKPALSEGMVDGITTLPELLGAIVPRKRGSARATAEAEILIAEVE